MTNELTEQVQSMQTQAPALCDLSNKVALVTGASRGIGRAIAIELARCGASVGVHYSQQEHAADETVATLAQYRGPAGKYQAEVSDYDQVRNMFRKFINDHGHIDILVNNAGVLLRSFMLLTTSEDFKKVIDVNLNGTFHCMKAAAPFMIRQRSGSIINMSSIAARRGLGGQGAYAASKAAIDTLTHVTAKELAPYNIRVNGVAPGCIDVGMMKTFTPKNENEYLDRIPLKRYGESDEVARTVVFLASGLSSYMTGHVLAVDGGMTFG